MENSNEKLVNHIKTIFDDFNDGGSEQGWAKFQEKYPQKLPEIKKIKLRKWWISGIAATTTIIALASPFIYNKFIKEDIQIVKTKTEQKNLKDITEVELNIEKSNPEILKNSENLTAKTEQDNLKNIDQVSSQTENKTPENVKNSNNAIIKIEQKSQKKNQDVINSKAESNNSEALKKLDYLTAKTEQKPLKNTNDINLKIEDNNLGILKNADQIVKKEQPFKQKTVNLNDTIIGEAKASTNNIPSLKSNTIKLSPIAQNDSISRIALATSNLVFRKNNDLKNKNTGSSLTQNARKEIKTTDKKETKKQREGNYFDIFASAFLTENFLNYTPSPWEINMGLGANKNIKLLNALAISIGASISQNNINYEQNILSSYPIPSSIPNTYDTEFEYKSTKQNVQVLSLDFPIALRIYPIKKRSFYLSAGVSSNYYLKIKSTNSEIITITNPTNSYIDKQTGYTVTNMFKGFDFANSAIVAFGFNQQLGNHSLTFEPYFKPAISDMGYEKLRINSIGINLKYNFIKK